MVADSLDRDLTPTLADVRNQDRLRPARLICLLLLGIAIAAIPVSDWPLYVMPEFVFFHASGVLVTDSITAYLLFGQFQRSGRGSLLLLASAYTITAVLTVPHMAAYPSMVPDQGRLIGGRTSATWLWHFWHFGFAVMALAYTVVVRIRKDWKLAPHQRQWAVLVALGTVLTTAMLITILATAGHDHLPQILSPPPENRIGAIHIGFTVLTMTTLALAFALLWGGGGNDRVMHLWLSVALTAAFGDMLITVFCGTRYTFGWFLGRTYGLVAASVLLMLFLGEFNRLHQRLAVALADLGRTNYTLEARVADRTADLENALKERNLLLCEVYHRVKNNMQVVDSLLAIEAKRLADSDAKLVLSNLRHRVYTLGLVHQQLMASDDLKTFDIAPFLRELCDNLQAAEAGTDQRIAWTVEVVPLRVNLDFAIPLGLLVTELLTNAIKHAFPDRAGNLRVSLSVDGQRMVRLSVADDGCGQQETPSGTGSKIIAGLVGQLEGTMSVETGTVGTRIDVTMPLPGEADE